MAAVFSASAAIRFALGATVKMIHHCAL
jgi:hypothetical protein